MKSASMQLNPPIFGPAAVYEKLSFDMCWTIFEGKKVVALKINALLYSQIRRPQRVRGGFPFSLFALAFSTVACVVVKATAQPPCCPPIGDPGEGGGGGGGGGGFLGVRPAQPEIIDFLLGPCWAHGGP